MRNPRNPKRTTFNEGFSIESIDGKILTFPPCQMHDDTFSEVVGNEVRTWFAGRNGPPDKRQKIKPETFRILFQEED